MNRPRRVVIADDHAVLRAGLRAFIEEVESPRLEVVGEASNGREAIELVDRLRPDLLLLDLSMPVLGGLETTIELRRRNERLRILVLTQFGEVIYLRRLLEAGANGYMVKTARGEELVNAIRAVLVGGTWIDPLLAQTIVASGNDTAPPESDEEALSRLTPRERQVLKLLAEGMTNKEVAKALHVAVKTAMAHRFNLKEKLGIRNRAALVRFAMRVGLIQQESTTP